MPLPCDFDHDDFFYDGGEQFPVGVNFDSLLVTFISSTLWLVTCFIHTPVEGEDSKPGHPLHRGLVADGEGVPEKQL